MLAHQQAKLSQQTWNKWERREGRLPRLRLRGLSPFQFHIIKTDRPIILLALSRVVSSLSIKMFSPSISIV